MELSEEKYAVYSVELAKIVRTLCYFIVVESKEFVSKNKLNDYVEAYLYMMSKTTNGLNRYVNMQKVKEQVLEDIYLLIEKKK